MHVLVTGGGSGIGRACAQWFVDQGDRVTVVGRRAHILDEVVQQCGPLAQAHVADCSDWRAVQRLSQTVDTPDVLVCAAGGLPAATQATGLEATAHHWLRTFELNVLTAVLVAEAITPRMRDGSRVIAVSSVSGKKGAGAYGAAKSALNGWVVDLARELAPRQITVNAVAPGYIPDTGFWDGRRDDDEVARRVAKVALGRPGRSDEVAAAVGYLASPAAGFTTGQVIGVDGGTNLTL